MKKIVFASLALVLCMTACVPTQQISKVRTDDITSNLLSLTVADLDVSQSIITFSYNPSKYEMKKAARKPMFYESLKQKVTYQYLVNSDADVVISPTMVINRDKKMKPISVTLTGHPAKFVNMRSPGEGDDATVLFYKEIIQTSLESRSMIKTHIAY